MMRKFFDAKKLKFLEVDRKTTIWCGEIERIPDSFARHFSTPHSQVGVGLGGDRLSGHVAAFEERGATVSCEESVRPNRTRVR